MDSGLDQTDYDRVFELLEPGLPPEAGFQQCRFKLIKFFSWRWCSDPANLADETIVRLLKNVKQGQMSLSGTLYKYLYAIALNVLRENRREVAKHAAVSYEEGDVPWVPESSDGCRELCLEKLSHDKRKLLNQYYLLDREKLIEKLQLSRNALRLRIHRIKEELRNCCEECEKRSAS